MAHFWRSKCLRKYETIIAVVQWIDVQVFQDRELLIDGVDQLWQIRDGHREADATHAVVVSEGKFDTFFILWSEISILVDVIDDERKRRGMCQHVGHWRAVCTKEGETEVGCRFKDEISPSSADMRKLVPPAFAVPVSSF